LTKGGPVPVFFHVDMDAFFASVEQLDHPEYAGKPVIVGARPGHRGVVSACSYEARAFGLHSAMPINEAARLCPQGVFLPVRMDRYQAISNEVFGLFDDFTPQIERVSIDEAFLDMTGTERLFGPSVASARDLKRRVKAVTGLAISVGVGPNRFVAKLASARSKPDGLIVVEAGGEEAFMDGLPLEKLWGAGNRTQERFRELNIRSVGELREYDRGLLQRLFGQAMGDFLFLACRGMDCGMGGREDPRSKSISTERTFEFDVVDQDSLEAVLLESAQELMYRLFTMGMQAMTVAIKIRYADFRTVSARRTLGGALSSSDELYRRGVELFREKREAAQAVRLLGLGVSGLEEGMETQGELFEPKKGAKLERAIFGLQKKSGSAMKKARNIVSEDDEG
jgi:DNA polymerase IV